MKNTELLLCVAFTRFSFGGGSQNSDFVLVIAGEFHFEIRAVVLLCFVGKKAEVSKELGSLFLGGVGEEVGLEFLFLQVKDMLLGLTGLVALELVHLFGGLWFFEWAGLVELVVVLVLGVLFLFFSVVERVFGQMGVFFEGATALLGGVGLAVAEGVLFLESELVGEDGDGLPLRVCGGSPFFLRGSFSEDFVVQRNGLFVVEFGRFFEDVLSEQFEVV